MRTPLGTVRGLGSAKTGTGDFIAQRVTSVALTILTIAGFALCGAGVALVLVSEVRSARVDSRRGASTRPDDAQRLSRPEHRTVEEW